MELPEIIEQLEKCEFECEGGPLRNNVAFIALKEMAEIGATPETVITVEEFAKRKAIKILDKLNNGQPAKKLLADGIMFIIYPTTMNRKSLQAMIKTPTGLTEDFIWNELAHAARP